MWEVTTRLAGGSRILIVLNDRAKVKSLSDELARVGVPHEVVQGGVGTMDERIRRWSDFCHSSTGVCLATQVSLRALPYGVSAFTVYLGLPTPQLFSHCTPPGSVLLFFQEGDDPIGFGSH